MIPCEHGVRHARGREDLDGCRHERGNRRSRGRWTAAAERGRELVTRADLQAEIAALEPRLAWRLITAGIAIAGITVAAVVTLTVAALRVLG